MEVLITYRLKVFLGNKYYSYILLETQKDSTSNFSEKIVMKRKKNGFLRRV